MFSLNLLNSVNKISVIAVKEFEPVTSYVGDQDATTSPAGYTLETGYLN